MNVHRLTLTLLAVAQCSSILAGEGVQSPPPPADALKFTARPAKERVELGDQVEIGLTFSNVSYAPLSINLRSAARCSCHFSCRGKGGQAGHTSTPGGQGFEPDRWQRIMPGDSFSMSVVHRTVSSQCIGKMKLTLRFHSDSGLHPPADWYKGSPVSSLPFYIEVFDSALLRQLRAKKSDPKVVRSELLGLLRGYEEDHYRLNDLFAEMERKYGALLVQPLADIAADATVDDALRSLAASHLGSAVYYSDNEKEPRLREIALPILKELVSHDSALVRRGAIWGLCCADRTQPYLEKFDALLKDPDEQVRRSTADYLTWFMDHRETWPYVKKALQDPSRTVRWVMTHGRSLMYPRTRDHVQLLLDCCMIANDNDTLQLLKGMNRCVSDKDLPALAKLFDGKPLGIQVELVKLAAKTAPPTPTLRDILKRALHSEHAEVSQAALEEIGRSADNSLVTILKDFTASSLEPERKQAETILAKLRAEIPFPDVKKLMAEILPVKKTPPPVSELLQKFKMHRYPKDAVAWLFLADDPRDVELLRPLLDSENRVLRAIACKYLGRIADQSCFEKIASLTQDPQPLVRRHAAGALGELRPADALLYLLRLNNDPSSEVRSAIRHALRRIPGGQAAKELFRLFQTEGKGMTWSIQETALDALVERGDRSVIPLLTELIDPPKGFSPSPSLPGALKKLSGHWIEGDYDDPADRKRLVKEWRHWWQKSGAAAEPPPAEEPQATYCNCRLTIDPPRQDEETGEVTVRYDLDRGRDVAPLTVPVRDEGVGGYFQYVLYRGDQEIERGSISGKAFLGSAGRYCWIPYGSIAYPGSHQSYLKFTPKAPPGEYEIQIEARYLCTEKAWEDFGSGTFAKGAHLTAAEVFTLKSNRRTISIAGAEQRREKLPESALDQLAKMLADPEAGKQTIAIRGEVAPEVPDSQPHAQTIVVDGRSKALELLRKEGACALPFVLKYFDPATATALQIWYLGGIDEPRAWNAIDRAFLAGNEYVDSVLGYLAKSRNPEVKRRLLQIAAAEIASKEWSWRLSRLALEALDGKVGPEDREHVASLSRELAARLISRRDRYSMRGGESLWGAFRTAFFLGRIGDKGATGILRRATQAGDPNVYLGKNQCIFLRWYAAAALKLIDLQNRPPRERGRLVKEWLRHCFSSPEEHFMSRSRLIPHLSEMLGEDRKAFYDELTPTLHDPWMIHDAEFFAGDAAVSEALGVASRSPNGGQDFRNTAAAELPRRFARTRLSAIMRR